MSAGGCCRFFETAFDTKGLAGQREDRRCRGATSQEDKSQASDLSNTDFRVVLCPLLHHKIGGH